jgi:predicted DNA-binding transcriptional regulator AlpA
MAARLGTPASFDLGIRPERHSSDWTFKHVSFWEIVMLKVVDQTELPMYLSLKEFRQKVFPIGERTVWRLISTGDFPKPTARIGKKTAVWRTTDLLAWVETQERKELSHRSVNVPERKQRKIG